MLIYSPNISFFITDSDTGHGVRLSLKIPRLLVSHVTPVNNVAICLEVLPCTGLVCAAAAENVQAAFAGLVAAETAAERERAAMIQQIKHTVSHKPTCSSSCAAFIARA
jgi:hypothetical protein